MAKASRTLLLPLLAALACRAPAPDLGPPPNVLLLVVDCLRADHLSVSGYERPTTANVDALAGAGIRFTRAVAQASWTRPSLPTILTGLYPTEHGLMAFGQGEAGAVESPRLADSITTVAEALKARGYRTAMIGEQFQLSPRFGLYQGFDFYKHRASDAANIHRNLWRWLDGETADGGGADGGGADGAGKRFFAYLHYLDIHWPYCPPPATRGTFNAGRSEIRFCHKWRQLRKDILSGAVVLDDGDRQAMKARYDEELLALDGRLGELFATLKQRGLWDDTLIVLTSDHGEEFWEHGSIGHGQSLHGELVDVPLIFKPPAAWRAATPASVGAVVELRHLAPTLLEAAGAPPLEGVAARSLVPWMVGPPPGEPPAPFAVAETDDQVMVRTESFKLIARRDGAGLELYDLAADPGETTDVAAERRRELERLRSFLGAWRQSLRPAAAAEAEELDPETLEGLKALGYIDG